MCNAQLEVAFGVPLFAEVGDQVAKGIGFEDVAAHGVIVHALGFGDVEAHWVSDDRAELLERSPVREMRGDRSEDVASVKGLTDGLQEQAVIAELTCLDVACAPPDEFQETVVRADEDLPFHSRCDLHAFAADAGIDDDDVHGAVRPIRGRGGNGQRSTHDVEGGDAVGDVGDLSFWGDAGDDALHGADVVVGEAEVGGERDHALRQSGSPGWGANRRKLAQNAAENHT